MMAVTSSSGTMQLEQWRTSFDKLSGLELIASGGFGDVYRAEHKDWGLVAFKKLKVDTMNSRFEQDLLNEAGMQKRLSHPSIVMLIGVVFEQHNYGIILEYMRYGTAEEFMSTFKVAWQYQLQMAYDVSVGMCYLHSQTPPIIHGDLKILNVLVGDGFRPKISDFGLSCWKKYSSMNSRSRTQRGTVTHVPPEMWENVAAPRNEKFDVYAFGVLLWELYTLKQPFELCDSLVISGVVRGGQRPDMTLVPPEVPEPVKDLMVRAWSQLPADRPYFGEIKDLLETLKVYFEDEINTAKDSLHTQERQHRLASASKQGLSDNVVAQQITEEVPFPCEESGQAPKCNTGQHGRGQPVLGGLELNVEAAGDSTLEVSIIPKQLVESATQPSAELRTSAPLRNTTISPAGLVSSDTVPSAGDASRVNLMADQLELDLRSTGDAPRRYDALSAVGESELAGFIMSHQPRVNNTLQMDATLDSNPEDDVRATSLPSDTTPTNVLSPTIRPNPARQVSACEPMQSTSSAVRSPSNSDFLAARSTMSAMQSVGHVGPAVHGVCAPTGCRMSPAISTQGGYESAYVGGKSPAQMKMSGTQGGGYVSPGVQKTTPINVHLLGHETEERHKHSGPHTQRSSTRDHLHHYRCSHEHPVVTIHSGTGQTVTVEQGQTTVYNVGGGGSNLQIGNQNIMNIGMPATNKPGKKSKHRSDKKNPSKQHEVQKITVPNGMVERTMLITLSRQLAKDWKLLGRTLGFTDAQLDAIHLDHQSSGIVEVVYQMLRDWTERRGNDATMPTLAKALVDIHRADVAKLMATVPVAET